MKHTFANMIPNSKTLFLETILFPPFLLALAITMVNLYSRDYIRCRIRHFERIDLPGAAEEAVRLRAKLRRRSCRDWRGGLFMCRDVGRRTLHLSYRLGW